MKMRLYATYLAHFSLLVIFENFKKLQHETTLYLNIIFYLFLQYVEIESQKYSFMWNLPKVWQNWHDIFALRLNWGLIDATRLFPQAKQIWTELQMLWQMWQNLQRWYKRPKNRPSLYFSTWRTITSVKNMIKSQCI